MAGIQSRSTLNVTFVAQVSRALISCAPTKKSTMRLLQSCVVKTRSSSTPLALTPSPFTETYGVHPHNNFASNTHLVPGFPNQDGWPMSRHQIAKTIYMMFDKDSYHQRFVRRDPLCMFFQVIGLYQASRIKKAKLIGYFKTAEDNERYKHNHSLSLARIIPHQFNVLKEVCAGLTELTIEDSGGCQLWDDNVGHESGRSDEEHIDSLVRDAVRSLPTLNKLQVSNHEYALTEEQMVRNWGAGEYSSNWVAISMAIMLIKHFKERLSKKSAPARLRGEYPVLVDQAEVAAGVGEAGPFASKPNFTKSKKRGG